MSSGNGNGEGYSIEARQYPASLSPIRIGKLTIDGEWRDVPVSEVSGDIGVPLPRWNPGLQYAHLLSYEAAQALRWWFHAQISCGLGGLCVESRLVKHRISWSYKSERVSEHVPIGGEDRSSIMPDWGRLAPAPPNPSAGPGEGG